MLRHLVLTAFLTASAIAGEIRVAAAASLSQAMEEIAALHLKTVGEKINLTFAGSNVLARQIEAGAPIDVFFSADEATMEGLKKKQLVLADTITPLLSNRLVVIVPSDRPVKITSASGLAALNRIALADPAAVPAGVYAKKWLESSNAWVAVSGKIIAQENVRAALAAVEGGNVDAGIVYRTDAAISKKVSVVLEVPTSESPAILYPAAVCKDSAQAAQAGEFIKFLKREDARGIFAKYGFILLPE